MASSTTWAGWRRAGMTLPGRIVRPDRLPPSRDGYKGPSGPPCPLLGAPLRPARHPVHESVFDRPLVIGSPRGLPFGACKHEHGDRPPSEAERSLRTTRLTPLPATGDHPETGPMGSPTARRRADRPGPVGARRVGSGRCLIVLPSASSHPDAGPRHRRSGPGTRPTP